ncbi:hypothetical protein [Flavobacterium sp. RS13.1]|uniref:hypothetical protein n=1 Tax=Flavobacterium sp. RS13.1 TaxID=3400345 RepID=UPI003AAFC04C
MNIYERYITAIGDFRKDQKENLYIATKSAESLFDIMYELEESNKDEDQNYLLARIYYELGLKWKCRKFVKSYKSSNPLDDLNKWQQLLNKVEDLFELGRFELVEFRDLRMAKKRNASQSLSRNDFVFNEDQYFIRISIKPSSNDIILLNKRVLNDEVEFSAEKQSSITNVIGKINSHFSWTNNFHKELIDYYNENYKDILRHIGRLDYGKADDEWYDGLRVESASFHYNSDDRLEGFYIIYDYYNMNSGFYIETLDNSITDLSYNTDL